MTLEECYKEIGGDYAEALGRLKKESLLQKFAVKFLSDTSYEKLCEAMTAEDFQTAFRCAHTLKGVSQNLGFTRLYRSAAVLTEALRNGNRPDDGLYERVCRDYAVTIEGLKKFEQGSVVQ